MSDTVLYDYWRSSASYRVRIALNLAGSDYRAIPVDLVKREHRSDDHMSRNPQGFVPVLDIDGLRLTQSLAILDYLDQTRSLGLLPKEPGERALQQALAHSIAVDVHPVCNLSVAVAAEQFAGGRDGARKEWMQRFIRPGLLAFETMLESFDQAPFCCGDTPGLADICLMPQVYNARRWEVDISDMPRLLSVETACSTVPAFAAAYPETCKPD
ncbi:maleylacetoacetate isomerase [Falsiphaeobacter marinintestinus]|uniref:maleylacetoacetate isomerase n=1 Tax=Falsiphaeobacter marinintestinus TaxID=1492905 RepID=UPI0011B4E3EF|nr:maleylacetoacetate isomerase [Phaeobacter marinintestinus]